MELSRFARRPEEPSPESLLPAALAAAVTPDHHEVTLAAAGGPLALLISKPRVGEIGGEGMPFVAPADVAGAAFEADKDEVCVVFSACVALSCLSRSVHRPRILPGRVNHIMCQPWRDAGLENY